MSVQFINASLWSSAPASRSFAVQDFETGTTTGSTSFTTTALGGVTPKAVMIIGSRHVPANDPNEDDHGGINFGFVDASRTYAVTTVCRDGSDSASGTSSLVGSNTGFYMINPGLGIDKDGDCSLTANGVSIDFTTNDGTNRRGLFMAFAGADTTAYTNSLSLGTGTSAIDITDPGFQPDVVIFINAVGGSTHTKLSFGVATSDGTQRCVAFGEDRDTAGQPFMTLFTDCCSAKIDPVLGTLTYKAAASAFDSSGFSLTPSANTGGHGLGYLALKFTGGHAKIVDFTTPTSTGDYAITGAGFTPAAAIICLTNLEVTDSVPGTSSAQQGGFMVSMIADEAWAACFRMKRSTSPQQSKSNCQAQAILGASDADCSAIDASFVSWDSDGMTLNFSDVEAAGKKGFVLFIE